MAFKDRLRLLREERGLSQQELGNILMLSKANVSKFETGKLQPSLQHLIALVQYFAIPAEFLLGLTDKRDISTPVPPPVPAQAEAKTPKLNIQGETDPLKIQIASLLTAEYTDIEKDILSRCLSYGLKQIEAIRHERMGYRNGT